MHQPTRSFSPRSLLLVTALLLLSFVIFHSSTKAQSSPEQHAVEWVAVQEGISATELEVANLEQWELPLTGRRLYVAKVINRATGETYATTTDETGQAADAETARQAEIQAYQDQYGSIHPDLAERLETMADGETLTVAIWLRAEGLRPLPRPDGLHTMSVAESGDAQSPQPATGAPNDHRRLQEKEPEGPAPAAGANAGQQADQKATIEQYDAANSDHLRQQVAELRAPLLQALQSRGAEPLAAGDSTPLIYVELPKSDILELAQRPDVDAIYPPYDNFDAMDVAKPTHKADVVENWGYEGAGVSVAILEDSRIEFDNPNLDLGGSTITDTVRVPNDANVDEHATATGGMVASQHGTFEGIAQDVDLYSANATSYSDSNLSDAMDWAVGKNIDIINNSWGGNTGNTNLNVHDRHLDYIVRYSADSVTVAAGNEANTCGSQTDRVASPARGFNVISVGGLNDAGTAGWDDDSMYFCSSFVDPSTGVEKPEVVASGANIVSTTDDSTDWIDGVGSGTSYAAPMVSGEAALLLERDATLAAQPESVKAIIMATALHNIEGDTRLSDLDGAGGVDMRAAFHLVDEGWWEWDNVQESEFPYTYTQYAHTGETVRAAIAWNSNPASDYSSDPLEADLDLRVYDADGNFVTASTSFDNSYEIVEFEAPETGVYRFRISEFRFDGTQEYVGFAFWPGHRTLTPYDPRVYDTPPLSHDYYRVEAADHWNAAGIRMPSGHDYDVYLYDGSAFADPDDHTWLEDSTLGGDTPDFVVLDGNHAPQEDYFLETEAYSGSGSTYEIEWATHSFTVQDGTYGDYTMSPTQLLRVWDVPINSGQEKRIMVQPLNGNIDLGLALFDTDGGDSSSWYQGRSQAVESADNNGLDAEEMITYTAGNSDEYGLVAWSNNATQSSDFLLFVDSSPPTGSIHISGGLYYTNTHNVNVGINVNDPHTSVTEMRFSNDGNNWSSWEPFSGSKNWTLTSGEGQKTVYGQFRNIVGYTSTISDTVVVDTTAPTASVTSPASTTELSFTVNWSGSDALSGLDSFDVQYRVGSSGSWTTWLADTSDTSAVFGPNSPVSTARGQTYDFRVRARDFAGNVSSYQMDGTSVEYLYIYIPALLRQ